MTWIRSSFPDSCDEFYFQNVYNCCNRNQRDLNDVEDQAAALSLFTCSEKQNLSSVKQYPDTISSVSLLSNRSQTRAKDQTQQRSCEPVITLLVPV